MEVEATMPVHITKFPSKDFEAQFEEAAANVWSYFDNAWIISKATRAQKSTKTRGCKEAIEYFMQELEASESFVRLAKQCGDAFNYDDVRTILGLCEKHKLLPSRDLFIQLVPVPTDKQLGFAEEMISQRLSTRDITLRRVERFGRTSKGTKKPTAPTTGFEAKEQAIKLTSRTNSFCESIVAATAPKKRRSGEVGFAVPASIKPHVKSLMTAWATIVKILEEAEKPEKSAA
jgi:hypothetical protein